MMGDLKYAIGDLKYGKTLKSGDSKYVIGDQRYEYFYDR